MNRKRALVCLLRSVWVLLIYVLGCFVVSQWMAIYVLERLFGVMPEWSIWTTIVVVVLLGRLGAATAVRTTLTYCRPAPIGTAQRRLVRRTLAKLAARVRLPEPRVCVVVSLHEPLSVRTFADPARQTILVVSRPLLEAVEMRHVEAFAAQSLLEASSPGVPVLGFVRRLKIVLIFAWLLYGIGTLFGAAQVPFGQLMQGTLWGAFVCIGYIAVMDCMESGVCRQIQRIADIRTCVIAVEPKHFAGALGELILRHEMRLGVMPKTPRLYLAEWVQQLTLPQYTLYARRSFLSGLTTAS